MAVLVKSYGICGYKYLFAPHPLLVNFYKFFQCFQRPSAFQRFAGYGNALFNLLFRFHDLNGKGGIDNDTLSLGGFCAVVQDIVEDTCRIFLAGSAGKFFGTYCAETESLWAIDAFLMTCHHFEFIGQ